MLRGEDYNDFIENYFNEEESASEDDETLKQKLKRYRMLQALKKKKRSFKSYFDCRKKEQKCGGVIPCCGSLQCYWPDGFSALKVRFI